MLFKSTRIRRTWHYIMIRVMISFKVLLSAWNVGMLMYLVWSSVWMISNTATQRSVCTLHRIPKDVNDTSKTIMDRNESSSPNFIVMKVCVYMSKPKVAIDNATYVNDSEKINGTLPAPPLTKSVGIHETISITISCVIATLTLITVFMCILRYCFSKSASCQNEKRPDVESQ